MSVDRLVWAVVSLTSVVAACITALTIWHPADNTAVVTAILGAATPAISVLVLLLQGQKVAHELEEVKQEARLVAEATAENLEGAKDSARRARDAHEKTVKVVEEVSGKVDKIAHVASTVTEIRDIVNGQRDALQRRIAELEHRLRGKDG